MSSPTDPAEPSPERDWLSRGVLGVGSASLLSDAGHELVTALLPSLITSLGSGAGALGVIDGVSDALTGVSKLAGGSLAADPARRGRLASGGYVGTAVATAAIGLCVAVWQVAALRAFAWISRGLRSPARDMVLTTVAPRSAYGRATGVERAGDNTGAILGPILAAGLVRLLGLRPAICLAFIPGVLAAVAITVAVRESRQRARSIPAPRPGISLQLKALHRVGLIGRLVPVAMFELGNLATTLLILRGTDILEAGGLSATRAATITILLYSGHNAVAAGWSLVAGILVDRVGPRSVLVGGALCYLVGYLLLGWTHASATALVGAFVLSGVGIACGETAESAWVALSVPPALRSNGFGLLGLVQAVGDLGATLVAGLLWSVFSPTVAFSYAAAWMLSAVVAGSLAGRSR